MDNIYILNNQYLLTSVLRSVITPIIITLQCVNLKPKYFNLKLLELQLSAYNDLYHNIVQDHNYNVVLLSKADDHLRKFFRNI